MACPARNGRWVTDFVYGSTWILFSVSGTQRRVPLHFSSNFLIEREIGRLPSAENTRTLSWVYGAYTYQWSVLALLSQISSVQWKRGVHGSFDVGLCCGHMYIITSGTTISPRAWRHTRSRAKGPLELPVSGSSKTKGPQWGRFILQEVSYHKLVYLLDLNVPMFRYVRRGVGKVGDMHEEWATGKVVEALRKNVSPFFRDLPGSVVFVSLFDCGVCLLVHVAENAPYSLNMSMGIQFLLVRLWWEYFFAVTADCSKGPLSV